MRAFVANHVSSGLGSALGCKLRIVFGQYNIRSKWVYPENDDKYAWENVDGNIGVFREGYANPIDPPEPDGDMDLSDESSWISSDRHENMLRWDFFTKMFNALGDTENIERMMMGIVVSQIITSFLVIGVVAYMMGGM